VRVPLRLGRWATLLVLMLGLALPVAAEVQPQSSAPPVPGLRLPRDVVPIRYAPRLTIDPEQPTFTGTIDIVVRVERATDVVWLNAKDITLRDVKAVVGGAPSEDIAGARIGGSDDVMGIRFERPLPVGEALLTLNYTAAIQSISAVGVFRQRENDRWYVVTQFEPMDARRAFPCFDEPDAKAEWRLALVIPRALRAFANMPVEREAETVAGMKEVTFARTPPLPSYLVAFAVGDFDVRSAGTAGRNATPINIVFPKGRGEEAAYAATHAAPILAAAERYFGEPFPFPKLDLLAYPRATFGGAMENPGLITYTAGILLARPDELSPAFEQRFIGTTAHEVAHMWFGDYVTMAWWNDLWLNESFASWLGTRIAAELRPDWGSTAWRLRQRSFAIESDRLSSARSIRQPVNDAGEVRAAFDGITYAKGETVLAMFEQWLGPDKFREGVRRYMAKHAWSNATADDFFAALAASDDALVPALRGFVERPGVPVLSVALDCSGPPTLRLSQQRMDASGGAGASPERWVFPACFDYGDAGKGRVTCTLVREATQSVPLESKACPQWVVANRTGIGYYLPRLTPALYAALPKAEKVLADADYEPLLADLQTLARSGIVGYAEALSLAARQANNANPSVARRAFDIPGGMPPEFVAPENAARYAAWLRRQFGPRAHFLGWEPRKGESPPIGRLREVAVTLVATDGNDAALAREARRLVKRWQSDRAAVPPQVRRIVFQTAAYTAGNDGPALFDIFVTALRASRDQNERNDLLQAIGAFGDPVLQQRAVALAFDPAIESRDGLWIVRQALWVPAARGGALDWLGANFDQVSARLPREQLAVLITGAERICSADDRARFVAVFGKRSADIEGGARYYRQTLEKIDTCLAVRRAQAAPLNAYLATLK
jgi:alanyl aminopeptidase